MVSCFLSRIVILIFGTLYPAYASYKAVRTKNVKEYVKWMMYWIVFALFTCAETFTDLFLSFWFPFYYEIKIITVIYLLSPATKGSSILYRKFVHPVLIKREQEIDEYIAKAKEQGYHTMLNLGSKGVTYATSLIMQTAIKGGGGLVNQLRKSYSLGDLSEDQHRIQKGQSDDDVDSRYSEDPRFARGFPVRSPRRTIANASEGGLYFPEVDTIQQPIGADRSSFYGHIPSSEEISSGYSSGDPFYYDSQRPKGDHLVRTGSLGGASRVRTRAATKTGLPKRSQLSEDGSTWSAVEPGESQIEPEAYFNYPLTHSASFPFPFGAFGNLVRPEYQQMFGNVPQAQMFAFINQTQYSSLFRNNSFSGGMPESRDNGNPSVVISEVKNDDTSETVITENSPDDVETEGTEVKEKFQGNSDPSTEERTGKYNKKPAPVPPVDDAPPKIDDDEEFRTPNSSPKPERKVFEKAEEKPKSTDIKIEFLDVPKKKSKIKRKESQISKKLHLPKMPFSFWHPKSGKNSSESESSSVASIEVATTKPDELEYYIPLKDEKNKE